MIGRPVNGQVSAVNREVGVCSVDQQHGDYIRVSGFCCVKQDRARLWLGLHVGPLKWTDNFMYSSAGGSYVLNPQWMSLSHLSLAGPPLYSDVHSVLPEPEESSSCCHVHLGRRQTPKASRQSSPGLKMQTRATPSCSVVLSGLRWLCSEATVWPSRTGHSE